MLLYQHKINYLIISYLILSYADVSPAFKKGDKFDEQNYRPVSLLPTVPEYLNEFFSPR